MGQKQEPGEPVDASAEYREQPAQIGPGSGLTPEYIESAAMLFQAALPDIAPIYREISGRGQENNILAHIIGVLPDPDPFLRKSGYSEAVLDSIMGDARVTTVSLSRKEATLGQEWEIRPGLREGQKEPDAAATASRDLFLRYMPIDDMQDIIGEILNAPLFGYVPIEIMYAPEEGAVVVWDIRPRERRRFKWNSAGEPRFYPDLGPSEGIALPLGKFVFAQHYPEYSNPYGLRLLSRCYWPVFFKKAGWKFWAQFAEAFGSPKFFLGLSQASWDNKETRRDSLNNLKKMIQDSASVGPPESKPEVLNTGSGNASAYDLFIKALNHEITLVIQGEALTTEAGDRGARSLGEVEQETSKNRAVADRRIVKQVMDRILRNYQLLNDPNAPQPRFFYVEKEDLKEDRAERDGKLHRIGWRPTRKYVENNYAMEADDFELASEQDPDDPFGDDPDDQGQNRDRMFSAASRRRAAARHQDEVDYYVREQVRAVTDLSDEQVDQVVKLAMDSKGMQDFEDNLATIVQAGSDTFEAILSEVQVAVNMYGRQAAGDE